MALELSTAGVLVKYIVEATGGTRPTADYITIPNIKSIPEMSSTPNSLQVTDLAETGWQQYVAGLKDSGGSVDFMANNTTAFQSAWATFVDARYGGTAQVESITCTGAPSGNGDITITVTAAGMTGSPNSTTVALLAATHTTVTLVADAVVAALNLDAVFAAFFTASNVAGKVSITANTRAANDATMEIAFVDTDTTGTTFGATENTVAGAAQDTDRATWIAIVIPGLTNAFYMSGEPSSLGLGAVEVDSVAEVGCSFMPNYILGWATAPTTT